jgi:hypothetical protein
MMRRCGSWQHWAMMVHHAHDRTRQSRAMSVVEAVTNVVVGYMLALGLQAVLFPLLGLRVSLGGNLLIGAAFTVLSIVRSFMLRRLFESFRVRQ